jgi:hypothetical protein
MQSYSTTKNASDSDVKQSAELDAIGWFDPFVPPIPERRPDPQPAPKPAPSIFGRLVDEVMAGEEGWVPLPSDTAPEAEIPAPAAAGDTGDAATPQPSELSAEPAAEPVPPPRVATAPELVIWTKKAVLTKTHLQGDDAEMAAHWALSTHFQPLLRVLPCLVITGHAHEASEVLHALCNFCPKPALVAGLERSHLDKLFGYETLLVIESNFRRRTADLLSSLTDKDVVVVNGLYGGHYAKSIAIYAGENPDIPKIQNSIHIHMTPTNARPTLAPKWLRTLMEGIPVHLGQYRDRYLREVERRSWLPFDLSSETATIAEALGRCIVGADHLRMRLMDLLKAHDQQRQSELSNTNEGIVVEATWALSKDGRPNAYAREIADAANHLYEVRGETARLRPENVGHTLKGLGLRTHRLSQTGNGLTFDKATVARLNELATMYMVDVREDTPAEAENLPSKQAAENNKVE